MNVIHVTANRFESISSSGHTSKIWKELAIGANYYIILCQSKGFYFTRDEHANILLLGIPSVFKKSFPFIFSSLALVYYYFKYDKPLILLQSPIFGGFPALLLKVLFRAKYIVEFHSDIYFNKRFLAFFLAYYPVKGAMKVRSLSSKMTSQIKVCFPSAKNVVEIYNRVNIDFFSPRKSNYRLRNDYVQIVSVGRFVAQKGYDIAIQAIYKLRSRGINVRLTLIGGGEKEVQLSQMIEDNNVSLINWIEQHELLDFLRATDIYIQPSLPFKGEAMPRTLLEASALGLPIVTTDVGAISGIFTHRRNCLLSNFGEVDSLAESIESLIESESLRAEIGGKAYEDVKLNYNWETMFKKYRALLYEA